MNRSQWGWLAAGLLGGLVIGLNLSGAWPQMPVHAMATHGDENFAISTGQMDGEVEAVYILDYLTGDLKAAVINTLVGKFGAFFQYNVAKEFTGVKNPKYLMVTGLADLRPGQTGNFQPSRSIVYVAEVTSGQVAAFAVPWNSSLQASGRAQMNPFIKLDQIKFRNVAIRNTGN